MVLVVDRDQGAAPFDAAALFALPGEAPAVQGEAAQLRFDLFGVDAEIDEEAEEHVAGSTGEGVEIKDHAPLSPRLMRVAA